TPYITIITRCSSCIEPQSFIFFFNDTATTEIYTLSLHDALPIFSGEIEVRVSDDSRQVIGKSPQAFDYQRKMVVSTVVGYRNDRGDEPWKDGKFKDADETKMASGFWEPSFMKFDPLNPKHLWMTFDFNNGLYLINFEDSTVTKKRSDFDRPRSIDFTLDGQHMIIAEDRGGENDRATYRLSR